jgi:hypothetical protein
MMNDIQFFEASRRLAERMLREGGASAEERLKFAFRLATARVPRPDELAVARGESRGSAGRLRSRPGRRHQGDRDRCLEARRSLEPKELAAYTMAAT